MGDIAIDTYGSFGTSRRGAIERERDMVIIAEMYLRGESMADILKAVNANYEGVEYSMSVVQTDLKKIRQQWVDTYLVDWNELMAREIAKIEGLEVAYWREYEKSQGDLVETEEVEGKDGGADFRQMKVRVKQRTGAATYLKGIQWCIEQRCKMFGLLAPMQIKVDWREEAKNRGIDNPGAIVDVLEKHFLKEIKEGRMDVDGGANGGIVDGEFEELEE